MTAPSPAVPAYASACSGTSRYSSACSYFGITTPTTTCISSTQATSIVNTFASLLTAPQAPDFISTANALLADDFKDTSGSINLLAGQDVSQTDLSPRLVLTTPQLSSVTFPSKAAFIAGQGAQPPIPTVTTLEIIFTCSKIAWRWVAQGIGSGQFEVKGINVFTITAAGQISEVFTEFNSGAWLGDIGNPQCPSSATS